MNKLIIHLNQAGTQKQIHSFNDGLSVTDAMLSYYPDGLDPESTKIYIGTDELILDHDNSELYQPLTGVTVNVIHEAKGLDPVTIGVIVAISLVTTLLLMPDIPGDMGKAKQSPNNQHQGQSNIARPYQAIPLVFGSPVSYPDLIGEPIIEYLANVKQVRQFMSVGIGLFEIDEVRSGSTPISNFEGANAAVYEPVSKNVTIPEYITSFQIDQIDNNEIVAVNDGFDGTEYDLSPNPTEGNVVYENDVFVFEVLKDTTSDTLKTSFDAATGDFVIQLDYVAVQGSAGLQPVSGTGVLATMVLDGTNTFYTITINQFNGPKSSINPIIYESPYKITEKIGETIGPIKISNQTDEVWSSIIFSRGLKGSADIEIKFEKLDGKNGSPTIDPPEVFTVTYEDNTLEQKFFTHKSVLSSKDWYQVTYRRTNNATGETAKPDIATLEAAYAISRELNKEFGNVTLLDVLIPASSNVGNNRENKINLSLTSKLISYSGGVVNYTPTVSRKFADAALHLYVDYYGLDPETLALDELYQIQSNIDSINPNLGTFDFTFDDSDVALEERMNAILQVARCYKWLDGDVYRFVRDEKKSLVSTVIGRRDIAQDNDREYSMKYNPQLLESFNSVKVEYIDSATNKKAYIYRSVDSLGNIINSPGLKPMELELAGCRELDNATNRAELEIRKLIYQRWSLNDTLLTSGMLLDKGDVILYAEQYENTNNTFDGEILSISGTVATTSEPIEFDGISSYQVHYTIKDGSTVGPFAIAEVAGDKFAFNCSSLASVFVRDSKLGFLVQTGSRYIISTLETLNKSKWIMAEKEAKGRNVQVTMLNYDERIYEFDEA